MGSGCRCPTAIVHDGSGRGILKVLFEYKVVLQVMMVDVRVAVTHTEGPSHLTY